MEELRKKEVDLASLIFEEHLAAYDSATFMRCEVCLKEEKRVLMSEKGSESCAPTYYREPPDHFRYWDAEEIARILRKDILFLFRSSDIEALKKKLGIPSPCEAEQKGEGKQTETKHLSEKEKALLKFAQDKRKNNSGLRAPDIARMFLKSQPNIIYDGNHKVKRGYTQGTLEKMLRRLLK